AASGAEAVAAAREKAVDFALIESRLPDLGAEQLKAQIRQARPGCRVVVLTNLGAVRKSPELMMMFGASDSIVGAEQVVELVSCASEAAPEGAPSASTKGRQALIGVVDVLVGLLELSDRYFGGTSHQAMRLARALAEEMGFDEETRDEVVIATL